MLQMKSPGLESIAPIDMPLDPYQMQRSNAQLRDGAMQQYTLNNTVQLGEKKSCLRRPSCSAIRTR